MRLRGDARVLPESKIYAKVSQAKCPSRIRSRPLRNSRGPGREYLPWYLKAVRTGRREEGGGPDRNSTFKTNRIKTIQRSQVFHL
jgi:hypothetical protein